MKLSEPIRMRMSELPRLLELIGPNGETKLFEILPKKDGLGAYINKASQTLLKYFGRS